MSAPDLEKMAREAGEAGHSYTDWSMSDEVFNAVAKLDEAGVRFDTRAFERAHREGRRAFRHGGGWIARWTTAPADYDQFGTETVEECGEHHGKKLRKVLIDPNYIDYQEGRYASGLHGSWTEDPREEERRWAEERVREKAEAEERAARRKTGLEWLATAPDVLVDGDEDAFDEELRAHGLRWEDGRDERRNRKARREAEERAATWARCRAALPDGATLIDKGTEGYRGYYGWVPGRAPRAWRSVAVRPGHGRADDAAEARVIGEGNDDAGSLLAVADALAAGVMRLAGPDEHVPPRAVVLRVGKPYTEILRVELGGKVAWAGEPTFGDLLVLDDAGKIVRTKALREAAEREWWTKRTGGSAG